MGPYTRRTIVGMRIKKALSSDSRLIAFDGAELSVADLVKHRPRDNAFNPNRSGSFSLVQATFSVSLLLVEGDEHSIPAFKGEVEARIQTDVLRLAGRFRSGFRYKDDRVKLPLDGIVHARVRSSIVDLWLRSDARDAFQRITLELFTPEAAGEFVEWLPHATPWPGDDSQPSPLRDVRPRQNMVWAGAIAGTAVVLVLVLTVLLSRRMY